MTSDDFTIGGTSSIAAGSGTVTFEVATPSTNVNLGGGASGVGTAGLSATELQGVTARILEIEALNGNINFDGSVTFGSAQGDISLKTSGGTITQNAGTSLVFPQGFVAQAGAGNVTLDQAGNNFNVAAIDTTGNVTLRDIDSLIIGSVKDASGTAVHGISGNNVTITTGYTTTGNVTAGSATVTVAAAQDFAVGDQILIRGAGTVATSGTVGVDLYTTVTAVDAVGGTITVANSAGVSGTAKAIVRLPTTGTMASGASTVTVGSVSGLKVGDKIVVAGAGPNNSDLNAVIQNITPNGGSPPTYTLQLSASAAAAVSQVAVTKPTFIGNVTIGTAAANSSTITLGSTSDLSNGDPLTISGAGSGGADLTAHVVSIAGNTVTLDTTIGTAVSGTTVYATNQNIAASGVVTLNTGADGVTEAGGSITGSSLLLTGNGSFNLSGPGSANNVVTLAADVSGSISYSDVDALTIGTVSGTSGITTRSHLTSAATPTTGAQYSTANIILNTNTGNSVASGAVALQINQPIIAGIKDAVTVLQDPADPDGAVRTGQALIFINGDTNAVTSGAGLIDASLLNLSSNEAQGTYDLTTKVASLSTLGGKSTTVDNSGYTGNLTILTLGQFDQKITGTITSAGNSPGSPSAGFFIDSSQTFTSAVVGKSIKITAGTGNGDVATIIGVDPTDASRLILAGPWTTVPDSTSQYQIGQDLLQRAGNVSVTTGGSLTAVSVYNTGNLAFISAGPQTIQTFTSTGQNLLFRTDSLNINNGALVATQPGVNIVIQPYNTGDVVGIANATGSDLPHAFTTGSINLNAGTTILTVNDVSGLAVGDTISIPGAGPAGGTLSATITAIDSGNKQLIIDTPATTTVGSVAVSGDDSGSSVRYRFRRCGFCHRYGEQCDRLCSGRHHQHSQCRGRRRHSDRHDHWY